MKLQVRITRRNHAKRFVLPVNNTRLLTDGEGEKKKKEKERRRRRRRGRRRRREKYIFPV